MHLPRKGAETRPSLAYTKPRQRSTCRPAFSPLIQPLASHPPMASLTLVTPPVHFLHVLSPVAHPPEPRRHFKGCGVEGRCEVSRHEVASYCSFTSERLQPRWRSPSRMRLAPGSPTLHFYPNTVSAPGQKATPREWGEFDETIGRRLGRTTLPSALDTILFRLLRRTCPDILETQLRREFIICPGAYSGL